MVNSLSGSVSHCIAASLFVLNLLATQAPPGETPRSHVEVLTSSPHQYRIRMAGTVDGINTRDPVIYKPWKQGFEPMRLVRLENIGVTEIVNPWVIVNDKRDWRTAEAIVAEALRSYGNPATMTDRDRARAIYEFVRTHRFHATTGDFEVRDPVKLFNVYGYALCGDNAPALMDLWRLAGLKVRRGFPNGHCVSEAWYEGAWHLLDADEAMIFLQRDNETIASDRDVARDHDLIKRTVEDETDAALYSYDGPRSGEFPSHIGHTMNFRLRPGESLEWRWGNVGKLHYVAEGLYSMKSPHLREHWGEDAWALLCNGKWIYAPPLRNPAARSGVQAEGIAWAQVFSEPAIHPVKASSTGSLVWTIETPYVIVGGNLRARLGTKAGGSCVFQVSIDGLSWQEVFRTAGAFQGEVQVDLDKFFSAPGPARYRYWIRANLHAQSAPTDAGIDALRVENDLQMAPLSLPSLELGENIVRYSDETRGPRSVRITFQWVERSWPTPPPPPPEPVFPTDGAQVDGTQLTLRWKAPVHPEGDRIVAYFFQLSDDPALRWALSSAFEQMVPATENPPSFLTRKAGLLNPGKHYYWHVRAKTDKGVWSPWSSTWSFVPQGPGVPLSLRMERTADGGVLLWNPNPKGRAAVSYLVYVSNEKGFSVSDVPYEVNVGNQQVRGLFPGKRTVTFPANLLARTTAPRLVLNPVHAFYRVVAVDARGIRSGPSDYVEAPRPWIYSKPPTEAKVGVPYRYEVKTISSIGDLTYRSFPPEESYQAAFWDADQPKFSLVEELPRCGNVDPAWLKLDPKTGVLSGVPRAVHVGEYQINIRVEIPGAGVDLQSFPLRVMP